mmetsp:Transcript_3300/g.7768  ORF Transcript_3300/g.7768 Transcript_3300/m.7768 type:complete len:259 (-) Transcript_3300:842-1618(-)
MPVKEVRPKKWFSLSQAPMSSRISLSGESRTCAIRRITRASKSSAIFGTFLHPPLFAPVPYTHCASCIAYFMTTEGEKSSWLSAYPSRQFTPAATSSSLLSLISFCLALTPVPILPSLEDDPGLIPSMSSWAGFTFSSSDSCSKVRTTRMDARGIFFPLRSRAPSFVFEVSESSETLSSNCSTAGIKSAVRGSASSAPASTKEEEVVAAEAAAAVLEEAFFFCSCACGAAAFFFCCASLVSFRLLACTARTSVGVFVF